MDSGSKQSPCPVCGGSGNGILILRQINATEALYVCNNPECFYPVGDEVTIIKRAIPELMSDLERVSAMGACSEPSSVDFDPRPAGVEGMEDTCSGEEIVWPREELPIQLHAVLVVHMSG